MTVDPAVSVVTIFRDAEPFLCEAVESVLAQTVQPVELLLVDDGSTDGSTRTARAVAAADRRVRYLEHPGHANLGMGASRNVGVRCARAGVVAFLDGDDRWDAEHLAAMLAQLDAQPEAALACASAWNWFSWADPSADDVPRGLAFPPGEVVRPGAMLAAALRVGDVTVPTCSLLVRTELWRRVGGADAAFRGMFEDQAMLAKLHLAAPSVISGTRTAWYRRHDRSASAKAAARGDYDPDRASRSQLRYLRWLERYLRDHPLEDGEAQADVEAALQDALAPFGHVATFPLRDRARRAVGSSARTVATSLPEPVRAPLRRWRRSRAGLPPALGEIDFGQLRRTDPISRGFGFRRGLPVDRHYIEQFLAAHASDIQGRVLEVGDSSYTTRFGGDRVAHADVLHVHAGNPVATVVADLADAAHVPSETWDCIILTQTLHLIYDLRAAVETVHRILRPGGVVLATVPALTQQSDDEWSPTWYWSLTSRAARRLFSDVFGADAVDVEAHGNVLAAVAFLHGAAAEELRLDELDAFDPEYELLVTVRARRLAAPSTR